jgi:hypothetical protein
VMSRNQRVDSIWCSWPGQFAIVGQIQNNSIGAGFDERFPAEPVTEESPVGVTRVQGTATAQEMARLLKPESGIWRLVYFYMGYYDLPKILHHTPWAGCVGDAIP